MACSAWGAVQLYTWNGVAILSKGWRWTLWQCDGEMGKTAKLRALAKPPSLKPPPALVPSGPETLPPQSLTEANGDLLWDCCLGV